MEGKDFNEFSLEELCRQTKEWLEENGYKDTEANIRFIMNSIWAKWGGVIDCFFEFRDNSQLEMKDL